MKEMYTSDDAPVFTADVCISSKICSELYFMGRLLCPDLLSWPGNKRKNGKGFSFSIEKQNILFAKAGTFCAADKSYRAG